MRSLPPPSSSSARLAWRSEILSSIDFFFGVPSCLAILLLVGQYEYAYARIVTENGRGTRGTSAPPARTMRRSPVLTPVIVFLRKSPSCDRLHCMAGGTRFIAALRGAKARPRCCPRIALRFILGYFRSLPAGREEVIDLRERRKELSTITRNVHAIALTEPLRLRIPGSPMGYCCAFTYRSEVERNLRDVHQAVVQSTPSVNLRSSDRCRHCGRTNSTAHRPGGTPPRRGPAEADDGGREGRPDEPGCRHRDKIGR